MEVEQVVAEVEEQEQMRIAVTQAVAEHALYEILILLLSEQPKQLQWRQVQVAGQELQTVTLLGLGHKAIIHPSVRT